MAERGRETRRREGSLSKRYLLGRLVAPQTAFSGRGSGGLLRRPSVGMLLLVESRRHPVNVANRSTC